MRYGEQWGRHWLDVARYADSTGNDEDHRYPYAWRYRDYVTQASNDFICLDQERAADLLFHQNRFQAEFGKNAGGRFVDVDGRVSCELDRSRYKHAAG